MSINQMSGSRCSSKSFMKGQDMVKKLSWRQRIGAAALVAAMAFGAPFAAHAGTSYSNYSTTIGKLGGNGYTGNQTKAVSSKDGNVSVTRVGDNRTVGTAIQKSNGTAQGTARTELAGGYTATLPNSIPANSSVRLKFWGNPVWVVAVQVTGSWRSN